MRSRRSLYRSAVCRGKEDADGTAFRSQGPRCHGKASKDEWGDNVKGINAVTADCNAGCGGACQVEKNAGIRPLLEPRKTWREYGNGPQHFPKSQDGEKVHWLAKDGHYAMNVAAKSCHLRDPAASDKKRYQHRRSPISNGFCFHSQSNPPPSVRSRPSKKRCQPYFAP
jgi:hypothetical protein